MSLVRIARREDFEAAFGYLGAKVGSRVGATKRTQDEKEWFVLRRFMERTLGAEILGFPVLFEKVQPPKPDFEARYGEEDKLALIEITEATHPGDQKEMTDFAKSDKSASLLGEFGGRFVEGASQPKFAWASDIHGGLILVRRVPRTTTEGYLGFRLFARDGLSCAGLGFDATSTRGRR
jgi:hypothetical protein